MDIVAQTTTTYSVLCADCGAHGPHRPTSQAAASAATNDGWTVETNFNGLRWYSVTRCPTCYAEHKERETHHEIPPLQQ